MPLGKSVGLRRERVRSTDVLRNLLGKIAHPIFRDCPHLTYERQMERDTRRLAEFEVLGNLREEAAHEAHASGFGFALPSLALRSAAAALAGDRSVILRVSIT